MSSMHVKLTMPAKVTKEMTLDIPADKVKLVERKQRELSNEQFAHWAMENLRAIMVGPETIDEIDRTHSTAVNRVWHK